MKISFSETGLCIALTTAETVRLIGDLCPSENMPAFLEDLRYGILLAAEMSDAPDPDDEQVA